MRIVVVNVLLSGAVAVAAAAPPSLSARLAADKNLVDAGSVAKDLLVELRYSTPDNLLKKDVYGDLERCYLARPAAKKLAHATQILARLRPGLRLLAYDCVRPLAVQRAMWRLVKGTREQPYVADPARRSMHNLGCAVDLTLADARGKPLPMGTAFDHAGPLAQPRLERRYLLEGRLQPGQLANRLLLRHVMVEAGFVPLEIEWWHFDCMGPPEARKTLPIVR